MICSIKNCQLKKLKTHCLSQLRDRLSQSQDSLIREIISCITRPYQLYNETKSAIQII